MRDWIASPIEEMPSEEMPVPRPMTPQDVFAFRSVSDPRIAAGGGRIVATVTRRDILTDRRVSTLIESRDRTNWTDIQDTDGVGLARLSPDGVLALLRRQDGRSLVLVEAGSGWKTLHDSATPLRELAWSADGATLAFQQRIDADLPAWLGFSTPPDGAVWAERPRHSDRLLYRHDAMGELPDSVFHTFVVAVDGTSPARQLTQGPWHSGMMHHVPPGLVFTPDGTELLLTGTQRADWDQAPNDVDIHALRLADGRVRRVTHIDGTTAHPAPSPDGTQLAFTAVDERGLSHQLRRLYVVPLAGGVPREVLPGFDRSIGEIGWTDDGTALLVSYDDPGCSHIARVALDGTLDVLARDASAGGIEAAYAGGGFCAARDGTLVYVRTAADVPSEVALVAPGQGPATLTQLNADLAAELGGFVPADTFWVAGGEGRQVQCWLLRPPGPGPHPLVLNIHGGPFAQWGDRFSIKHQALVGAGYAVLYGNPAGSTGYGEDFANALHDRFPGPDFHDLMAALDEAAARADIDADNLFITGASGGGVLTLWGVTHTRRFRAAVAIKPVVDWQSWVLSSDIGPSIGRRWMGGALPWDAAEKYRARSPLAHAQHASAPTLLMAGEADSRTPMSETLQMYGALRLAGVDAHLLRFPGVSHSAGTMRPSLYAAELSATIGWFDRHRTPRLG